MHHNKAFQSRGSVWGLNTGGVAFFQQFKDIMFRGAGWWKYRSVRSWSWRSRGSWDRISCARFCGSVFLHNRQFCPFSSTYTFLPYSSILITVNKISVQEKSIEVKYKNDNTVNLFKSSQKIIKTVTKLRSCWKAKKKMSEALLSYDPWEDTLQIMSKKFIVILHWSPTHFNILFCIWPATNFIAYWQTAPLPT